MVFKWAPKHWMRKISLMQYFWIIARHLTMYHLKTVYWGDGLLLVWEGIRSPGLDSTYLTDRWHRTVVDEQSSIWLPVLSDVPQGSTLGPLLFNIYVNIIPSEVMNGVKNYMNVDHRSCRRNFCSCEKKAWKKKFRLVRESNPWPLRYRCNALPTTSRSLNWFF